MMDLTFLGTGGAWGLPELNCDCHICREMRRKGEKRERTALLLSGESTLLIDCGPDIASQLSRHSVAGIDAILISHEHGDHYLGLDELFAYKRAAVKGEFQAIPLYVTEKSWEIIGRSFSYLEEIQVIKPVRIEPGKWFKQKEFEILPFKTDHGSFAQGSVGFVIRWGKGSRLVYTADFAGLPEVPLDLLQPDYLVIESFWLNEPVRNRPNHMSFQRAIDFIARFKPKKETFLVHMGDTDMVAGDPANSMSKKYEPKNPLRPSFGGNPYPTPLNQAQWQKTVDQIMSDRDLPYKVIVAYDDLHIHM